MMLVGSALKGFAIEASDGPIGSVSDLLSDAPVSRQMETNLYGHYG